MTTRITTSHVPCTQAPNSPGGPGRGHAGRPVGPARVGECRRCARGVPTKHIGRGKRGEGEAEAEGRLGGARLWPERGICRDQALLIAARELQVVRPRAGRRGASALRSGCAHAPAHVPDKGQENSSSSTRTQTHRHGHHAMSKRAYARPNARPQGSAIIRETTARGWRPATGPAQTRSLSFRRGGRGVVGQGRAGGKEREGKGGRPSGASAADGNSRWLTDPPARAAGATPRGAAIPAGDHQSDSGSPVQRPA